MQKVDEYEYEIFNHLAVVENDNTGVSVILLFQLIFRIDALPLNLGKHTLKLMLVVYV